MVIPHQACRRTAVHRPRSGRTPTRHRTAHGIVADLAEGGYVVKKREGRRNSYQIQPHLPLHTPVGRERTIGEVLGVLMDGSTKRRSQRRA